MTQAEVAEVFAAMGLEDEARRSALLGALRGGAQTDVAHPFEIYLADNTSSTLGDENA